MGTLLKLMLKWTKNLGIKFQNFILVLGSTFGLKQFNEHFVGEFAENA